jgi:hypothetical protein
MKKIIPLFIACIMVVMSFGLSCKKTSWNDLEYSDINYFEWLQANVKKKGGEGVLWFQVFDLSNDKATADSYKNTNDKIENYPAKIFANKWIWILINNRIEIRLVADDKSKEFQDTDKLKKFILSFDLSGMENVKGPKLKGKDFEKFIPKMSGKK